MGKLSHIDQDNLPAMVDVISVYSSEDLMAVADYLSRMEWPKTQDDWEMQYE